MSTIIPVDTHVAGDTGHIGDHNNMADVLGLIARAVAQYGGTLSSANTTNVSALSSLVAAGAMPGGLRFMTGGGTITASTITTAQAAGYQGIFLDPLYVWDASGLVITNVRDFTIESCMGGSIGWVGNITYNTSGYIKTDTGTPADGIQIYGDTGAETQGITLRGLALVGSNPNAVLHLGGRQRAVHVQDSFIYNTNATNTTIAAGSNGVALSTFAGAGVLNVASTAGFASSGNILVASTTLPNIGLVHYTGITGTTFTGCTLLAGGGTMATSGLVWQAAFGYVADTAIKDFNSEEVRFRNVQVAGQNCAIGFGINDITQHHNDSTYYDLTTCCQNGPVSMVSRVASNLNFFLPYDRSPSTGATTSVYWNDGGQAHNFWGGEDQNSTSGVCHLLSGGQTTVNNRLTTSVSAANTITVQAGIYYLRGRSKLNGTCTVNSGATMDLADPACNVGSATINGSGALVLSANPDAGGPPTLSGPAPSYAPMVVATKSGTGQTTAQSLTFTPPAANCSFRVRVMVHPTVAGTSTVASITFTERGPTARSYSIPCLRQDGASTAFQYLNAAIDSYVGEVSSQTDNSAANIVVTVTPTGSTYRYSITIELLATS